MEKVKVTPEKSILEQMRNIREKLSIEIKDMNKEQLKVYLDKQKTLFPTSPR